jgi:hypothetical protein
MVTDKKIKFNAVKYPSDYCVGYSMERAGWCVYKIRGSTMTLESGAYANKTDAETERDRIIKRGE